jgi:hypothetical protein
MTAGPDRPFLSRWSSRKRRERARPSGTPDLAPQGSETPQPVLSEEEIARLPDPDTLAADADFTQFLRVGVPEALKRRALRRLWRVNPVISAVDGLNDYDLDYTDAATVVAELRTLYRAGRGMMDAPSGDEDAVSNEADAAPDRDAERVAPDYFRGEEVAGDADGTDAAPSTEVATSTESRQAVTSDETGGIRPSATGDAYARRWGGFSTGKSG